MPGEEQGEIQESSEFIRRHMATKGDIAEIGSELKEGMKDLENDIDRIGEQVGSIAPPWNTPTLCLAGRAIAFRRQLVYFCVRPLFPWPLT